jgi:hypothetical protein
MPTDISLDAYRAKQRVADALFTSHKAVISNQRDKIARLALAQDMEWLLSNTLIIPHALPTLVDLHATVQLPEERITIKLPIVDL